MALKLLPHSAALSEFQGYTGDCGEDAELAALHVLRPDQFPLDAAHLNAIVQRMIHAGKAGSKGEEPLSSIAWDLTFLGIKYDYYPYAEPFGVDWRNLLRANAGERPIIVQLARAGQLPGDEPGVQYHFVTILGTDGGVYLVADGDNPDSKKGLLSRYTEANLAAAQICGLIITEAPPGVPMPFSPLPGGKSRDTSTGEVLGTGFTDYVNSHHTTNPCILGDRSLGTNDSTAFFKGGLILRWTDTGGVVDNQGGEVALLLYQRWQAAQAQVAAVQKQVDDLHQQISTSITPEALQASNDRIAALTQQLAVAQANADAQKVAQLQAKLDAQSADVAQAEKILQTLRDLKALLPQ